MPLSFAGEELIVPVEHEYAKTISTLRQHERAEDLGAHDFLPWQGQHGRPWNGLWGCRPGTLVWPTGATRWAEASFYAGETEKDAILAVTAGKNQAPLVMDDGVGGTITAEMFALPPRPIIQQNPASENLFLIHLVDQRYFWQGRRYGGSDIRASQIKSANDLITAIQGMLGVTISKDSFSSSNLVVPVGTDLRVKSVAGLLDMVAQSLGLRVVCGLDGSVSLRSVSNALSQQTTNLKVGVTFLGGSFEGGQTWDYLPSKVRVNYPRTVGKDPGQRQAPGEPYYQKSINITLPGQVGNGDTYDLMTLEEARYDKSGDADPANKSTIDGYASTYVQNWYNWQMAAINKQDSGITAASPDGLHRIEWNYSLERCTTRFIREGYDVVPWWSSPQSATSGSGGGTKYFGGTTPSNFKAWTDDPITVPAGNTVVVPLDFVFYDTDKYVGSDRATMPVNAKYHFDYEAHGTVTFDDMEQEPPSCIEAWLRINGTVEMYLTHSCHAIFSIIYEEYPDIHEGQSGHSGTSGVADETCVCLGRSTDHKLGKGDYVELVIHNPSAVDLHIGAGDAGFSGHMIDDIFD